LLHHARPFAQRLPRAANLSLSAVVRGVRRESDLALAAAVVATGCALAKTLSAERGDGFAQVVERADVAIFADGKAIPQQPVLLRDAVLNHLQHAFAGAYRHVTGGSVHAGQRDLFDLQRDDVATASQPRCLASIVPPGLDALIDNEARGASGVGIEHVDAVAHAARGHRGEASKLPAAEDANRRARQQRRVSRLAHAGTSVVDSVSSDCVRTSSRRAARQAMSFACSLGSVVARICTASNPALVAPAAPMESVATGTPFGICTIESSESRPCSAVAAIGTPSTGSTVFAATMPGRCAAPPAPAMMTRRPRPAAASA